ncbi:MAG: DUF1824 family protein [Prochlorothrix sp.]|nr:DUF1824 family protein [Prochlorothrix sp.]
MPHFTETSAETFLNRFICLEDIDGIAEDDRAKIREALSLLIPKSDYQTLGVCAEALPQAVTALNQYLKGLGHDLSLAVPEGEAPKGAVYLKYNTRKQGYYLDRYQGPYRGVLVSLQSDYADGIQGTYGHFPLDLFI